MINPSRKPISCLCLSPDNKYLAYGECGHSPCVRICDISVSPPIEVMKLQGHAFGITCLTFSPNLRYLVSVGYQHDQNIHVWNWRNNSKVATNKITAKVNGISFSEDGCYFVTVGNRRVRYWYFDTSGKNSKAKLTHPLNGRSAILGEQQNNSFVAVACGRDHFSKYAYVLTASGLLCQFNDSRELEKLTEVKSGRGYCLLVTQSYVLCGCADGVIRLFDPISLDYIISLPRPHHLGVDLSVASHLKSESGKCPDTVAVAFDDVNNKLAVVYNDHSLYIWDIKNVSQIGKTHSFLYHNACVWDICVYPEDNVDKHLLPPLSFVTCSSDNTIRNWSLESSIRGEYCVKNVYSKELIRITYNDTDTNCLRDTSKLPGDSSAISDTSRGVRCIQFHPEGIHLAIGDRLGNLKIYDLQFMDKIHDIMAHDAEILSIEYSPLIDNYPLWLATGSRDRLVHLFDVRSGYIHTHTVCDHSGSITSVKFSVSHDSVQLISCGADKSLVIQEVKEGIARRINQVVGKATMYDMLVDPVMKFIATVGQDKLLRIYSMTSFKQRLSYKACASEEGSTGVLKAAIDPSGLYVATSGGDKVVCILDFFSGECVAKLHGHSEVITALRFSNCCHYLYTVSGDSCIFVWKLSHELIQKMQGRLTDLGKSHLVREPTCIQQQRRDTYSIPKDVSSPDDTDNGFRFSVSKLPAWAQRQIYSRPSIAANIGVDISNKQEKQLNPESLAGHVTGKWADRVTGKENLFNSDMIRVDSPGTGSESSESEIDQLTQEMTKVLSLEIESPVDLELVNEEYEDGKEDKKKEERNEEEDGEEEVVYPDKGRDSVDPSMFKVTTPERKSHPPIEEDIPDDTIHDQEDSTLSTPDEEELEVVPDEEVFIKTHFESLSSEKANEIFTYPFQEFGLPLSPRRPSISTKYLTKSRGEKGYQPRIVSLTPPNPLDLTSPPMTGKEVDTLDAIPFQETSSSCTEFINEEATIVDSTIHQSSDSHVTIEHSGSGFDDVTIKQGIEQSDDNHVTEHITDSSSMMCPRPQLNTQKSCRRKITPEEVSKARKRLEELGYADEYVHSIKSKNVQQDNNLQQEIEQDQQQVKDKQQQEPLFERQEEDERDSFLGERNVICDGSVKCDSHHKNEDDKEEELQDESLIIESAENIASNICREMTKLTSLIHKLHKPVEATSSLKLSVSDITHQCLSLEQTLTPQHKQQTTILDSAPAITLDPFITSLIEHYSERIVEAVQHKLS